MIPNPPLTRPQATALSDLAGDCQAHVHAARREALQARGLIKRCTSGDGWHPTPEGMTALTAYHQSEGPRP